VEEIRVPSETSFTRTAGISLEEMAALQLEGETRYLRGVLLDLHLSQVLKQHFDAFALASSRRLTPEPRKGVGPYRGERILLQPLPYQNRFQLVLPLAEPGTEGREPLPPGTLQLASVLSREDFPLLVAIQPLMKGIPDAVAESDFFLTVRPLLERKGVVTLSLLFPAGSGEEPLAVYLDDRELTPAQLQALRAGQELPAGLHGLRIASSIYKEVNVSFTVESGRSSGVEVRLERLTALLTIDAPQGAEVFLDGERLTDLSGLPVDEGNHQLRVKIAHFSLSKKFTIPRGKHYHLSCIFDIIITED